jgi:hypothetical protein
MKTNTTSKAKTKEDKLVYYIGKEKLSFYIAYGKDKLIFSVGYLPSKTRTVAKDNLQYEGYTIKDYGPIKVEECSTGLYKYLEDNYEDHSFFEQNNWSRDDGPSAITTIAEKRPDGVWELKSILQKQKQDAILEKDIKRVEEKDFLELTSEQKSLFLFRELSKLAFEAERLEYNKQDKETYY